MKFDKIIEILEILENIFEFIFKGINKICNFVGLFCCKIFGMIYIFEI